MKTKTIVPEQRHLAFMGDLKAVLTKHGQGMQADEMLAIASQLVGQLLALQDQRKYTPGAGLELIGRNIEIGNAEAIKQVLGAAPLNGRPV